MKLYQAVKNADDGVFKSPNVEGKNLFNYELVNEFFVDNSGFGSDSEPALTAEQFLNKVKENYFYGITRAGQFQVYIGEFRKIKKTKKEKLASQGLISRKKVANNTYELETISGEIKIRLHNTDIITYKGNKIILNSGGYKTWTTKNRLNRFLNPLNIYIYQKNFVWYIIKDKKTIEFFDNIEL